MHEFGTGLISAIENPLLIAGFILMIGYFATRVALLYSRVGRLLCQVATFGGFTAMLFVADVVPFRPTPTMDFAATYIVVSVFKIVWWVAGSWLFAGLVHVLLVFKRRPDESRFVQDVCSGVIYVGAVFGIVSYVFDLAVSGLLAASGVVAIVLGLALQNTLGDVFSGVVLNLAKPYHPGDWVTVDGGVEGRVIETNWRATFILTISNDVAIVPNSVMGKSNLVNASKPEAAHGLTAVVRLDPSVMPSTVVAILETAMLNCNRILRLPAASVSVRSLDAVALECELQFFVSLVEQGPAARNEVFDLVFRHCASANIRLAPPSGSPLALPARGARFELAEIPKRLLERLPLFATLSEAERLALAPKIRRRVFKSGEILVEEGIVADALFILTSGVLVALRRRAAVEIEVMRLAPGDCFCQASVLTGAATTFKVEALTKAVVYTIGREDLAPIMKERPGIAAELSQIMIKREAVGKARLDDLDVDDEQPFSLSARIAERIKVMFGL